MSTPSPLEVHLGITAREYDERIRTFVPFYEEMLGAAAAAFDVLAPEHPTVVDLGIGTGALAERCLALRPGASAVGVDQDASMLALARARLARFGRVELRQGSFLEMPLPPCDVIVACLALHHVPDPERKQALYRRCREALSAGGRMILADCHLPSDPSLRDAGFTRWRAHLAERYGQAGAEAHLAAWAHEDTYFPLADEGSWLEGAGFRVDVAWRRDLFAVLACGPRR